MKGTRWEAEDQVHGAFGFLLTVDSLPLPAGQKGSMGWMGGKERPTKGQE